MTTTTLAALDNDWLDYGVMALIVLIIVGVVFPMIFGG